MSSFIDAVEQRARELGEGSTPTEGDWRQALTEVLAEAGPVYQHACIGLGREKTWADVDFNWYEGAPENMRRVMFTAPPADALRIEALTDALNTKTYAYDLLHEACLGFKAERDERDARIAELKIELNKAIQQSLPRRNETDSLRNQLAAAQAALESDPLKGAAKWLRESIADCQVGDLQFRLGIGYNRAKRLFDAASATDQSAAGSEAA
jgi:hypothetical protein